VNAIAAGTRPTARRPTPAARLAILGAAGLVLGACGPSPPPVLYVLGVAPAPVVVAAPQAGLPVSR
jgi:hypothetical protein